MEKDWKWKILQLLIYSEPLEMVKRDEEGGCNYEYMQEL